MKPNWVITADWHIGHVTDARLEENGLTISVAETFRQIDVIINYCIEHQCRLFVLGDVFHDKNPLAKYWDLLNQRLMRLNDAKIETILLNGNHDSNNSSVSALAPINSMNYETVHAVCNPEVIGIDDYNVILLPHLLENKYEDHTVFLQDFIQKNLSTDHTNVVIGHLQYPGSVSGYEERIIKGGIDLFPAMPDECLTFLGHVHMPQQCAKNVYYSGSITVSDFSERESKKSFIIFDGEDISRVPLSTPKYVQIELDYREHVKHFIPDDVLTSCKGALIKIIVYCTPETRKKIDINFILENFNQFGYVKRYQIEVEQKDRVIEEINEYNPITYFEKYCDKQGINDLIKAEGVSILKEVL